MLKKQWTTEEEEQMLLLIRRGEAFNMIAKQHERTENAIRLRFGLICKKQLETRTMQDICREYRVTSEKVKQCMDALQDIQDKNKSSSSSSPSSNHDLNIIQEEIQKLHDKIDRIYKHVRKLVDKKK